MKRLSLMFVAVIAAAITFVFGQDKHEGHAHAAPTNPQLEKLKKLAGEWTGKAEHGEMEEPDMRVIYKVTAAGSCVMETLFPGSDHEMITMYCMDGDTLMLTHYCSMGNQPRMKAEASKDPNVIMFVCTGKGGNMKSENDPHMHSAMITFVDDNHIKSDWTMFNEGKKVNDAHFELKRKGT